MEEFTLTSESKGKYSEKGSTFSAIAIPVFGIAEVKTNLHQLKEQFPDASHICYGYRIKVNNQLDEFSTDAGEPKGSAGIPVLNVLKRNQLVNVVIFVIRYFGGSKLGIPGLINAYGSAAEQAIENSTLQIWAQLDRISFNYNYDLQNKVGSILQKFNVKIITTDFGESIQVNLEVEVEKTRILIEELSEISNGAIKL
ncbi:MAG: YigZ family protein [Candidatus Marinimicrobia bacterium]|nr:YigZ family protein [Candidatus Neomarinimicrobiota bacterium]